MIEAAAKDCAYGEWRPPAELERHVAAIWVERSRSDGAPYRDRALPDGCIDIVYGRSLWVRGPETHALGIGYPAGSTFIGLRFRPGAGAAFLGLPAGDILNRRVPLDVFWGKSADELAEQLDGAHSLDEVRRQLERAIAARALAAPLDPLFEAVTKRVATANDSVRSLADELGVSERQLRRRCHWGLGYGPKTFARIVRFQRFRALAERHEELGLAALAAYAGYADQPHLTRECRRLSGETPRAFLTSMRLRHAA